MIHGETKMTKSIPNKGTSICPICKRMWLVTPFDDCLMPTCGCFGDDVSHKNKNRLCERCGIQHAVNCKVKKLEG